VEEGAGLVMARLGVGQVDQMEGRVRRCRRRTCRKRAVRREARAGSMETGRVRRYRRRTCRKRVVQRAGKREAD